MKSMGRAVLIVVCILLIITAIVFLMRKPNTKMVSPFGVTVTPTKITPSPETEKQFIQQHSATSTPTTRHGY